MSHGHPRTEKNCLNCGAEVLGRFCQECGQENIVPKETTWQLVQHAVFDIFHFDTKFFATFKDLIRHPGMVTKAYFEGKRKRYMNPISLYLFVSAVFFIVFYSIYIPHKEEVASKLEKKQEEQLKRMSDSLSQVKSDTAVTHKDSTTVIRNDTTAAGHEENLEPGTLLVDGNHFEMNLGDTVLSSPEAYEAYQKSLPEDKRDNWIEHYLQRKSHLINAKYKDKFSEFMIDIFYIFLHNIPKILFFLLPVLGLILKLLYIRRKRYYVEHIMFMVHYFIYCFLFLMVLILAAALNRALLASELIYFITGLLLLVPFIYLFLAMRNYYGQGFGKTFVKYTLFNFISFIILITVVVVMFGYSMLQLE